MIRQIKFHRFKQFGDDSFVLHPGVSLLGGGNNAGKSTILHGLAIWEFCRTALEMERGPDSFLAGYSGQGLGLGDDEFSPINVPSLKHLWTNLKVQRVDEQDGYTLQIRCEWLREEEERFLESASPWQTIDSSSSRPTRTWTVMIEFHGSPTFRRSPG
jgi:hypothetical protein